METETVPRIDPRDDRVRAHTPFEINERIDEATIDRLRLYARGDGELITRRLEALDREWDMERLLETNAASLSLVGVVLGTLVSRRFYVLPFVVAGFLLQHAIQGWCPPVSAFRRANVRTRKEIDRERHALKVLRGDYQGLNPGEPTDVRKTLEIVAR